MRVRITKWLTDELILDVEAESVRAALEAHIEAKKSLRGANLRDANLGGADEKTPEEYAQIAIEYREKHPDVPVVAGLDKQICEIVNSGQGRLKMSDWHACETTHCRAGWAIHLAGEAGYALEAKRGPEMAGGMIYRASTGRWPNFFATDDAALSDICAWGSVDSKEAE